MKPIPASVSVIEAAWLESVLKEKKVIERPVSGIDIEPMGEGVGLMGEMARLRIRYEKMAGDSNNFYKDPETLVVKCAAQNENRQVARILDFYNRESNFYNYLALSCPIKVPASFYSAVDQDTYDCIFLMEDLGDVTVSDQIQGASFEQAVHSLEKIAEMHAKWWNRSTEYSWAYEVHSTEELGRLRDFIYMPALEPAVSNFQDRIGSRNQAIMRAVGEHYPELFGALSKGHHTFVHGDYRLDNIIYQDTDNGLDSKVLDWQISGKASPMFDVAYFLCQSLDADLCAATERELLEIYHAKLVRQGIADYEFSDCWNDYRIFLLFCLIFPVSVGGSLDLGNERGRNLAAVMLDRNLAAIERLNSEEFLTGLL